MRRLRIAELDVEAVVTSRTRQFELLFRAGEVVAFLDRPAQLHVMTPRSAEQVRDAASGLFAPQIVTCEIDRSLAERLADGERRPDGAVHAIMNSGNVFGIGSENDGGEIVPQRRFDGLDRFVGPGLDRDGLAAALRRHSSSVRRTRTDGRTPDGKT